MCVVWGGVVGVLDIHGLCIALDGAIWMVRLVVED